jgi:hypothetical protein
LCVWHFVAVIGFRIEMLSSQLQPPTCGPLQSIAEEPIASFSPLNFCQISLTWSVTFPCYCSVLQCAPSSSLRMHRIHKLSGTEFPPLNLRSPIQSGKLKTSKPHRRLG